MTNEEPINFIAVTNILDRAHRALRGIDAADLTQPIPAEQIDAVCDAVEAIEEFARERGIKLSEFQPPLTPI
jgi:hypothetical protein